MQRFLTRLVRSCRLRVPSSWPLPRRHRTQVNSAMQCNLNSRNSTWINYLDENRTFSEGNREITEKWLKEIQWCAWSIGAMAVGKSHWPPGRAGSVGKVHNNSGRSGDEKAAGKHVLHARSLPRPALS